MDATRRLRIFAAAALAFAAIEVFDPLLLGVLDARRLELIDRAAALGITALAITDLANLFGMVKF